MSALSGWMAAAGSGPRASYEPGQLQLIGSPALATLTMRYCMFSFALMAHWRSWAVAFLGLAMNQAGSRRQGAQADQAGAEKGGEEGVSSCEERGVHGCSSIKSRT